MGKRFRDLRSPEVAAAAEAGAVAVLPFGQTEEHGPHLPIVADTLIAERLCDATVEGLDGTPPAHVLDAITYGYSQKVLKRWPGTFILPDDVVLATLEHIMTSLVDMGFRKIVVVSCHGNHVGIARMAARRLADKCGVGPGIWFPASVCGELLAEEGKAGPGGSCHAGEFETALMLHLAPELVDMDAAPGGDAIREPSAYPSSQAFVSTWTRQESVSGAYGDPTEATAEFGKRLFEKMVDETVAFIRHYHALKQVGS